MTVEVVAASASRRTGEVLKSLLTEQGVSIGCPGSCRVSYGVTLQGGAVPTLNSNAGLMDKYEQMVRLAGSGVLVPRVYEIRGAAPFLYPLLARKRKHKGGKDIRPIFQAEEIPWREAAGWDFLVEYVPWVREYRTWVYRRRHCGTYIKEMAHMEQYRRIGANSGNGFAFRLVSSSDVPAQAVELSAKAVDALELDFGAVDVLEGRDGQFYCLEVNTAPGIMGDARFAMRGLARHIARWTRNPVERRGRG